MNYDPPSFISAHSYRHYPLKSHLIELVSKNEVGIQ